MNAYIYQAALWCSECTRQIMYDKDMVAPNYDRSNGDAADAIASMMAAHGFTSESDYDSDNFPKGPYGNGGGEADCPQHCDGCGVFLENPLTGDGYEYVHRAVADGHVVHNDGGALRITWRNPTVKEWSEFYEIQPGSDEASA